MNISKEELERIKESNKVKDLQSIIAEEKDKNDSDDEADGGDQNFIHDSGNKSAMENQLAEFKRTIATEIDIIKKHEKELTLANKKLDGSYFCLPNKVRNLNEIPRYTRNDRHK